MPLWSEIPNNGFISKRAIPPKGLPTPPSVFRLGAESSKSGAEDG
jgi:hypothetical protein